MWLALILLPPFLHRGRWEGGCPALQYSPARVAAQGTAASWVGSADGLPLQTEQPPSWAVENKPTLVALAPPHLVGLLFGEGRGELWEGP